MNRLFETRGGWAALILRLGLGLVMLPHALQALTGWHGGPGLVGTYNSFTRVMHIPPVFAVLALITLCGGWLGLILGFLTRVAALGILGYMAGAVYLVHWPNGFFMNWYGKQAGEGFEFHLLAMTIALALAIAGGGSASVDRAIASRGKAHGGGGDRSET
jgi:putative oxidoreductase